MICDQAVQSVPDRGWDPLADGAYPRPRGAQTLQNFQDGRGLSPDLAILIKKHTLQGFPVFGGQVFFCCLTLKRSEDKL